MMDYTNLANNRMEFNNNDKATISSKYIKTYFGKPMLTPKQKQLFLSCLKKITITTQIRHCNIATHYLSVEHMRDSQMYFTTHF